MALSPGQRPWQERHTRPTASGPPPVGTPHPSHRIRPPPVGTPHPSHRVEGLPPECHAHLDPIMPCPGFARSPAFRVITRRVIARAHPDRVLSGPSSSPTPRDPIFSCLCSSPTPRDLVICGPGRSWTRGNRVARHLTPTATRSNAVSGDSTHQTGANGQNDQAWTGA